jgi:C1A family cysteine protease
MEGTIKSDSGAQIRDGIKSVAKLGVCPEPEWPYDINKFATRPPKKCFTHALKYRAVSYQRVIQTLNQMKGCLASGYPFVFGFSVYDSFEGDAVAKTGTVPMPAPKEKLLGGHAVLAVGYDDKQQRFLVRNSWGKSWGIGGYFTMPYAYMTDSNLCDDLWTIRVIAN